MRYLIKKNGTRYKTALTPAARYNYNEKNFYSSLHNLRNEHGWGAFFTKAKTTLRALTNCQVVFINTAQKDYQYDGDMVVIMLTKLISG